MTSEDRSTRTVIYAHLKHFKDKVRNRGGKEEDMSQEESKEDIVHEKSTEVEEEDNRQSQTVIYAHVKHWKDKVRNRRQKQAEKEEGENNMEIVGVKHQLKS